MKTLYIIRGVPGSGKSSWARTQLGVKPFEADDFFMRDGVYRYQADLVPRAHEFCKRRCENAMKEGVEKVTLKHIDTHMYIQMIGAPGPVQIPPFEITVKVKKN